MLNLVAIEPRRFPEYEAAVCDAGGSLSQVSKDVRALIWTDYSQPNALAELLDSNPQIEWVQLPFAGVDAFSDVINRDVRFTSAKGSYREPVAEHALALSLALMRAIPERVRATSWGKSFAVSLFDSNVLIYGGGGITEELVNLLAPFRAKITVLRKRPQQMVGVNSVLASTELLSELPKADLVVITAALTSETSRVFNRQAFEAMKPSAYLVNIARGPLVHTDDLIDALSSGELAGAALDVTDPEPLPEGHPLWQAKNILITPHTADTREMVVRLFSDRIRENVLAFFGGEALVGQVSAELGY
ncbi:MAG: hypothetical protein RLZZ258_1354 [Actinomycetota bacterium]